MAQKFSAIKEAKRYSDEKIEALRDELSHTMTDDHICVATVGSFARREASRLSDLDFFLITDNDIHTARNYVESIRLLINKHKIKMPSRDGAFNDEVELSSEMTKNIGGMEDKTEKLTRRLLFLLEGEWLYNKNLFHTVFNSLIHHYVRETITDHQLSRFLLNDLIRYYRTICVDFEYKTYEGGKPWGDRNIKLQFSRKLLYFSGIVVVAETAQHHGDTKREILKKMLRLTPLDRVREICGSRCDKALLMYNDFLEQMASEEVREMLRTTPEDRTNQTTAFRIFKNKGHHFTWELSRLLIETYDASHPIHNAIRF